MASSDILSLLPGGSIHTTPQLTLNNNQETMVQLYDAVAPFSAGTNPTDQNRRRTRKEIYTKWEQMLKFAQSLKVSEFI